MIKIKDGHRILFTETRTLLLDESDEEVEINKKKPIRIWSEGGKNYADIPCVGGVSTPEPVAGALLIAAYLNMDIVTAQGTFKVVKVVEKS